MRFPPATRLVMWGRALAQVSVAPDSAALPGGAQLQQIVNGISAFALIALVGATIAGAVWWATSASTAGYSGISGGKRMVLVSALGAIVVGGAAA
ncbi:MAG: hypothetical protein ACRDV9_06520, partial [Acidimicrobiia bacterium]